MTRRKTTFLDNPATTSERKHDDHLTYFQRYQLEAQKSESVDSFAIHHNADGLPWLLSHSSAPIVTADDLQRVRDETIAYNLTTTMVEITGAHPNQVRRAWKATPEDAERCCAIKPEHIERVRLAERQAAA